MKTLIHTRIYALLTQNESNPSELAHAYEELDRKSTRLNSSHRLESRMPSSA